MRTAVSLAWLATVAVSGWMVTMYFVLRHPGYQWRAAIAAVICIGAALLIPGHPPRPLRIPSAVWAVCLAAFGVWALLSPSDDGWVIVAGLLFIAEGALGTMASVRR